jgi:hypothetical protein
MSSRQCKRSFQAYYGRDTNSEQVTDSNQLESQSYGVMCTSRSTYKRMRCFVILASPEVELEDMLG